MALPIYVVYLDKKTKSPSYKVRASSGYKAKMQVATKLKKVDKLGCRFIWSTWGAEKEREFCLKPGPKRGDYWR